MRRRSRCSRRPSIAYLRLHTPSVLAGKYAKAASWIHLSEDLAINGVKDGETPGTTGVMEHLLLIDCFLLRFNTGSVLIRIALETPGAPSVDWTAELHKLDKDPLPYELRVRCLPDLIVLF